MSIKSIKIKDFEEVYIGVARDCHLCGEAFATEMQNNDTVCPICKELWKAIVKEARNE